MSGYIIDRRVSGKDKSVPNRNRFLDRVRARVQHQVKELISNGSVGSIFEDGKKVTIPVGDIAEPMPTYSRVDGTTSQVVAGNGPWRVGDCIPKPKSKGGSGQGSGASGDGGGDDDFTFILTRDEFLKYFFDDLNLPNLLNKDISVVDEIRSRKAGYSAAGNPSNLSLLQTMRSSAGRRVALRAGSKRKLKELEQQLIELQLSLQNTTELDEQTRLSNAISSIETEMVGLRKKIKKVPFVDEIDLRYRNTIREPVPATHAVMICVMDTSGSMSEWHKEIAKRFYMLLFLFLHKRYESVELVFVRYTHEAVEVDENEFFYGTSTGGTVVSNGLSLVNNIIDERYNKARYNVYVAQASDGDTWGDGAEVLSLMNQILQKVQYFFYVDITRRSGAGMTTDLMQLYSGLSASNFQSAMVQDTSEIYTVFRGLFSTEKTAD